MFGSAAVWLQRGITPVCGWARFGMTERRGASMGEWMAQLSLRVREALRAEMEEIAARERRKLGNVGMVLLEWGMEQLKAAGSIERLLKYKIRPPNGGHREK